MIDVAIKDQIPALIVVAFAGKVTLDEITAERRFGDLIRGLRGAAFHVLCDFNEATVMSAEVAEVFLRAQRFAVEHGMQRDAFVCNSATLRLQFTRIADESPRATRLGELHFFDTVAQAEHFLGSG